MVKAEGSVVGTFHHVTGYTEFSSEPDEQEGYYFPFHLTKTGTKMTFKKNDSPTKQNIAFDPTLFSEYKRVTHLEVLVDNQSVVKFNSLELHSRVKKRGRQHEVYSKLPRMLWWPVL